MNKGETEPTKTAIGGHRLKAVVILVGLILIGWFVYSNAFSTEPRFPFRLGLDLSGGSHLIYEADVSGIDPSEVTALMSTLRSVIEQRINVFGVSEPIVYVERSSIVADDPRERLVIELPGITDIEEAVAEIGRTPLLEFKLVNRESTSATATDAYIETGLTGRYLDGAALEFASGQGSNRVNEPIVSIRFDSEGAELFASVTRANVGQSLAIFLDGELLSAPVINEAILGGQAVISGGFTAEGARALAQNLNLGALPVPIELVSTQTIGASLGADLLHRGIEAAMVGLALVALFMLGWYRLPGLIALIALAGYIIIMLALFMLIPVTLTAAGLAGLVISIGIAIDANILVFERLKEEYRAGKDSHEAARDGFSRAWSAIRDSNLTGLLSAILLFWFGTPLVKGFALVFGLGIIVSMFSALTVTRSLLLSLPAARLGQDTKLSRLYNSGFNTVSKK